MNANKSFQGSIVLGMGFVLTTEEAHELIAKDTRNRDVLFPYLNGEDLNSRPDQSPSRWVINFRDWPLDRSAEGSWFSANKKEREGWLRNGRVPEDYPEVVAADYHDCLKIVAEKVKPEREKLASGDATARDRAKKWWRFGRPTMLLYTTIGGMERVLVVSRVSKFFAIASVKNEYVFNERLVVIVDSLFPVLQSTFHEKWMLLHGSTLETRPMYTPTDCFETFPFPETTESIEDIGRYYDTHRRIMMKQRQEGLTAIYNRFHNPSEKSEDMERLRQLHIEMDRQVAEAYGWINFDLGHNFHQTKQGVRFTISEAARIEVLDRLLALNHERYAEEEKLGLHDKGKKKKRSTPRKSAKSQSAPGGIKRQPDLFVTSDQEELFEEGTE
ncbi:MAG: hypothetical protein L0220_27365 [Acidobacteria bacterium]|nr:hypothetical protein [Acidobacteriota bacterium]